MKNALKLLCFLQIFATPSLLVAYESTTQSKYYSSDENRNYTDNTRAVYDNPSRFKNSKTQIISFDSEVPQSRILNNLQEGVTDQLQVLKLLSAPNIITRSPQDKETWVYHWIWSYQNEADPSKTTFHMDNQGKRVRKNRKPVSLVITFNNKDIIESYSVKLIKSKRDSFSEL